MKRFSRVVEPGVLKSCFYCWGKGGGNGSLKRIKYFMNLKNPHPKTKSKFGFGSARVMANLFPLFGRGKGGRATVSQVPVWLYFGGKSGFGEGLRQLGNISGLCFCDNMDGTKKIFFFEPKFSNWLLSYLNLPALFSHTHKRCLSSSRANSPLKITRFISPVAFLLLKLCNLKSIKLFHLNL